MSGKHRALPPWMANKEGKVTERGPLKSRRKPKNARAVFYCMNEKELVQTAVSFLTNNAAPRDVTLLIDHETCSQIQGKAGDASRKIEENPPPSKKLSEAVQAKPSDCSEAHEMTYVSETDIDITEVETLPYTRSPQHQGLEGQGSGQTEEEHAQMPTHATEEDDGLRILREIFFT
ncbi:uncharacterized protein LOC141796881 isoform X2 [Halichoeres trimaculatus]|uniref:uncharacterized protein LOC141796881 isoform X2 n=1 Tax=Halichoeres trimaculatus TaxID=147232 RepID=UPI003D9F7040